MAINLDWDNTEHTIILITFTQPWTWHDFNNAIEEMIARFDSVNHMVDVIFDIRRGGLPPPNAITHFKKAADIQHPNGRHLVYVAPNVLVGFINRIGKILTIVNRSSKNFQMPKFIFTASIEEARSHLANPTKSRFNSSAVR